MDWWIDWFIYPELNWAFGPWNWRVEELLYLSSSFSTPRLVYNHQKHRTTEIMPILLSLYLTTTWTFCDSTVLPSNPMRCCDGTNKLWPATLPPCTCTRRTWQGYSMRVCSQQMLDKSVALPLSGLIMMYDNYKLYHLFLLPRFSPSHFHIAIDLIKVLFQALLPKSSTIWFWKRMKTPSRFL